MESLNSTKLLAKHHHTILCFSQITGNDSPHKHPENLGGLHLLLPWILIPLTCIWHKKINQSPTPPRNLHVPTLSNHSIILSILACTCLMDAKVAIKLKIRSSSIDPNLVCESLRHLTFSWEHPLSSWGFESTVIMKIWTWEIWVYALLASWTQYQIQ
jgi:hypothetical protein